VIARRDVACHVLGLLAVLRCGVLGDVTSQAADLVAGKAVQQLEATSSSSRRESWEEVQRQPEEPVSDAQSAKEAAASAASVAGKVATHSVEVTKHAQTALKHAQKVLHGARVDTSGLSGNQQDLLRKAEVRLNKAATRRLMDGRDGQLTNQDETNERGASGSELESMRQELRWLRQELEKTKASGAQDSGAFAKSMGKQLQEIEEMLDSLEAQENREGSSSSGRSHEELKAEIERLRSSIESVKTHGEVEVASKAKTMEDQETGSGDASTAAPKADAEPESDGNEQDTDDDEADASASGSPAPDSQRDAVEGDKKPAGKGGAAVAGSSTSDAQPAAQEGEKQPSEASSDIDVDTEMPYGDLEPFGREDTAQELTEASIRESDAMVDQLERAEVAEEKRAVFRALTRLRGAAITSFDGVARSQTGNIDTYNKENQWRASHPVRHLADQESDIAKWAFPDGGEDF